MAHEDISCFEVLDDLFGWLEAYSAAWKSSRGPENKIMQFLINKMQRDWT
jgi:hypothetical protein